MCCSIPWTEVPDPWNDLSWNMKLSEERYYLLLLLLDKLGLCGLIWSNYMDSSHCIISSSTWFEESMGGRHRFFFNKWINSLAKYDLQWFFSYLTENIEKGGSCFDHAPRKAFMPSSRSTHSWWWCWGGMWISYSANTLITWWDYWCYVTIQFPNSWTSTQT